MESRLVTPSNAVMRPSLCPCQCHVQRYPKAQATQAKPLSAHQVPLPVNSSGYSTHRSLLSIHAFARVVCRCPSCFRSWSIVGRRGTCCCCRPFDFTCVGSSCSEAPTSCKPRYPKAQFFQDQQRCPLRCHHVASSQWTTSAPQEYSAFPKHIRYTAHNERILISYQQTT